MSDRHCPIVRNCRPADVQGRCRHYVGATRNLETISDPAGPDTPEGRRIDTRKETIVITEQGFLVYSKE
jgi:hypothetical protein